MIAMADCALRTRRRTMVKILIYKIELLADMT